VNKIHSATDLPVRSALRNVGPLAPKTRPTQPVAVPSDHYIASQTPRPEVSRSLLGKLFRWSGLAGLTAVAATSVVGGIAYHANHKVLAEKPSVHVYPNQLPRPAETAAAAPLTEQLAAATVKTPAAKPGSVRMLVPTATLHSMLRDFQATGVLDSSIANATERLQSSINVLSVPSGRVLLDAKLPLPTSERALLHVGDLKLPSLGYRALSSEAVPLKLDFEVTPVQTGLRATVKPVQADPAVAGPGLLLGAVQVTIDAPAGSIPLHGNVALASDLDGEGTAQQLSRLQGMPGQEQLVQQLQGRLQQGKRLQELGAEQGFDRLLQESFGQNVAFDGQVQTGDAPLVSATLYLWATPDTTGDGKADIQVTQQANMDKLGELSVEITRLQTDARLPDGKATRLLHEQVRRALLDGARNALPQVTSELRRVAAEQASHALRQATPQVQQAANEQLQRVYGNARNLPYNTSLDQVQVTPDGLLVELQGRGGAATLTGSLQPGQFATGVDLGLLNRELRESVDWPGLLNQAKQKSGLLDLNFARNAQGEQMTPQLSVRDGRLALSCEVTARPKGAEPVKGATGAVHGATRGLDKGAADVQRGLKKNAGVLGDVIGTVIRAPFFAVDKVAEGGKFVADNTVGAVIDPAPEVLTRPTIHTRLVVPLTVECFDGALRVSADPRAVEFQKASSNAPFDVLDLLPTRMLSNLLVNAVAGAQGPAKVGEQVKEKSVQLDVQQSLGIRFESVSISRDGDLTVIARPSQRTAEWLLNHKTP
jgi:hypothetical protein